MTGAELLAKIGLGQGMRLVSKALDHLAPDNTKAFESARDELFREWQAETSRAMVDACTHLLQRIQDLEKRFEEQGDMTERCGSA